MKSSRTLIMRCSVCMALLSSSCRASNDSIRGLLQRAVHTEDNVAHHVDSDVHSPHRELLSKSPRVVGGRTAPSNRYTYTVSLQSNGAHLCGGVLIAIDVVLTAAHCTSQISNWSSVTVVIGRENLSIDNEGEELKVSEVMVHPNYLQNVEYDNDFALLFLSQPTMSKVGIVKVNRVNSKPAAYQSVLVLGWGDTAVGEYRQGSDLLREALLRIIPNSRCNNVEGDWNGINVTYDGYISESMMCASFKNRDSCQGDSGGPLIVEGEDDTSDLLVGLVSWGVGCANNIWPGVYARVSSGYNWIRREVCLRSVFPPEQFDCEPF
ncbi:hypothetical protein HJC23_000843 [Cyclotella cryptica]|uniref:Peptidase S1 domain-containing protein n=1 Tax=Cyclotella cryptica TaxID=29204 RepID=A0ABD3NZF9_9STRA|eukprot:CCRYP_018734-RA/>CCRYP_018734-RA protein AED:0.18 eAED:0.18 QI:0/-1/0/1/-1/1/1/0/321